MHLETTTDLSPSLVPNNVRLRFDKYNWKTKAPKLRFMKKKIQFLNLFLDCFKFLLTHTALSPFRFPIHQLQESAFQPAGLYHVPCRGQRRIK
ncbi:hypothetical protein CEXT_320811 [Caerostris extrusa]|uniref:Uncharacterized protein n=1 Tax=Caerostris extrusa TaxID=172846 RepID=A0AAV4VYA5_CAEEX|nr:hypothetical protein CEXT_320811 [Caerostris extrusa]